MIELTVKKKEMEAREEGEGQEEAHSLVRAHLAEEREEHLQRVLAGRWAKALLHVRILKQVMKYCQKGCQGCLDAESKNRA